jgi:N-acetylneuraminate lyase
MPGQRRQRDDAADDDTTERAQRNSWAKDIQRAQRLSGANLGTPPGGDDDLPPHRPSASSAAPRMSARKSSSSGAPKRIFEGLVVANMTPFTPSGAVNFELIPAYAKELLADGVTGVFLNGTTGESMSLAVRERKQLAEAYMKTGLKVCAMIGAQSLADVLDLAEHAESIRVHAIAVMVPSFFKPQGVADVVDFLARVAKAAPSTPLLLYHFPMITGTTFRLYDILQLALSRGTVPTIRGAKFTSLDLGDYHQCMEIGGPITDLLYASEPNICGATMLGATAFVGRDFSTIGPLCLRLHKAALRGDAAEVRVLQGQMGAYHSLMRRAGCGSLEKAIAATKYLVGLRLEVETGNMRSPGPVITADEKKTLREGMQSFVEGYARAIKGLSNE